MRVLSVPLGIDLALCSAVSPGQAWPVDSLLPLSKSETVLHLLHPADLFDSPCSDSLQ